MKTKIITVHELDEDGFVCLESKLRFKEDVVYDPHSKKGQVELKRLLVKKILPGAHINTKAINIITVGNGSMLDKAIFILKKGEVKERKSGAK